MLRKLYLFLRIIKDICCDNYEQIVWKIEIHQCGVVTSHLITVEEGKGVNGWTRARVKCSCTHTHTRRVQVRDATARCHGAMLTLRSARVQCIVRTGASSNIARDPSNNNVPPHCLLPRASSGRMSSHPPDSEAELCLRGMTHTMDGPGRLLSPAFALHFVSTRLGSRRRPTRAHGSVACCCTNTILASSRRIESQAGRVGRPRIGGCPLQPATMWRVTQEGE